MWLLFVGVSQSNKCHKEIVFASIHRVVILTTRFDLVIVVVVLILLDCVVIESNGIKQNRIVHLCLFVVAENTHTHTEYAAENIPQF